MTSLSLDFNMVVVRINLPYLTNKFEYLGKIFVALHHLHLVWKNQMESPIISITVNMQLKYTKIRIFQLFT